MKYLNDYPVKENCVVIHFSIFCDLSTSTNGGALNLNSYSNRIIDLSHNIFLNNKAYSQDSQGGAIYCVNIPCTEFNLRCSTFEHNGAYGSSSFYISNRITPIPLTLSQLTITGEYKIWGYSHMEAFGGNPLLFQHNNITNNNVPNYGLVMDYIPPQKHDIACYINFVSNVANCYILNDQNKMPVHYYLDKWNFANNTIAKFFGITTKSKEPSLFNCNFIFNEKSIVVFNLEIHFESCYFSNTISQSINNISTSNNIEIQFKECDLHISNALSIKLTCFVNCKMMILVSLFLLKSY